MLAFIAEYWLNFLLGAIAGGLTFLCKRIWKLYQTEKHHQKTKEQKAFYDGLQDMIASCGEESIEGDKVLQGQIDIIKGGILSIHRKNFKQDCRELLKEGHTITLEEFELLQDEHNIYNALGGNHDGDTLFEMVEKKVSNNLADK